MPSADKDEEQGGHEEESNHLAGTAMVVYCFDVLFFFCCYVSVFQVRCDFEVEER